jgi:hypothetical protein
MGWAPAITQIRAQCRTLLYDDNDKRQPAWNPVSGRPLAVPALFQNWHAAGWKVCRAGGDAGWLQQALFGSGLLPYSVGSAADGGEVVSTGGNGARLLEGMGRGREGKSSAVQVMRVAASETRA